MLDENQIRGTSPSFAHTLIFAVEEARKLKANFIGTEHILLGLIRLEEDVVPRLLLGLDYDEIFHKIQSYDNIQDYEMPKLPYTPRVKKLFEVAKKEAYALNHQFLGAEHLVLALIKEEHCLASKILSDAGFSLDNTRTRLINLLEG